MPRRPPPFEPIFEGHEQEPDFGLRLLDGIYVERGEWPAASPRHVLGNHAAILTHRPKPLVSLARTPTAHPWEVLGYLSYGGWNECLCAAEQVAVLRHWHDRQGAEIHVAVGDVVERWAPRSPRDPREQYLYCADIVDQGTGTLLNLAGALLEADAWFFWWD